MVPDDLMDTILAARARVRLRYPFWLRPFLRRGVDAITLGRRIYVAPSVAGTHLERLLRHELAHVRQANRLGLLRFYWRYLVEYVTYRRAGFASADAYRRISFEIEASAAEDLV